MRALALAIITAGFAIAHSIQRDEFDAENYHLISMVVGALALICTAGGW